MLAQEGIFEVIFFFKNKKGEKNEEAHIRLCVHFDIE